MQAGQGQFDLLLQPRQVHLSLCGTLRTAYRVILFLNLGWLALLSSTMGCARFQLPAIDPNGSSIFLPLPNTTQLTLPSLHGHNGQPGIIPQPAFASPAMPPPCIDGSCATGTKHKLLHQHKLGHKLDRHFPSQGKAGEIQLTPTRIVAPVGGEVVLLAGICGPNGYLVKRQPLEWMLSPDSVGTFIEVGDDSKGHLISSLAFHRAPKVEKLDVDFARGRTSNKETLIDRGSADCKDDIQLKEGQTWLSISSPSEGVSRITVLAPDSDIWDRRRQTATIYWVDAQWEFPQPLIAQSGNTLQFVTRVNKSENLVPAEDWIVQYTIVDPSVATFLPPTGSNVARIKVNSSSQAIVQVVAPLDANGQPARGTTPILIDVIRPAMPSDNMPEIVLGSGQTFATFSSPGLNLQAFGNDVGTVGEQLTYVASLGNPGDMPAENTTLIVNIPVGMRPVSAVPQPSNSTNTGLRWEQGALDAHRQLDVSVVFQAIQPGTFDVTFQAAAAGGLQALSSVRTEIVEASVDLRFEPTQGAAQAEIGQAVEFAIDVKNTSRQTITDLRVVIASDPGLPELETQTNQVEKSISYLQPGSTSPLAINFVVRQTGQQRATVKVYSGENLLAEKTVSVLGVEPRPKQPDIGLTIEFPQQIRVGETVDAVIMLRNPGEVKLTGLNVELQWDAALRATAVDRENFPRMRFGVDGRSADWSAQDLLPPLSSNSGDMVRSMRMSFECLAPVPQGALRARATAAEGVSAEGSKAFQAIAGTVSPPVSPPGTSPPVTPPSVSPPGSGSTVLPPVNPPPTGPTPGSQARTGNWEIQLNDYGDPTVVGRNIRYVVTIRNNQNSLDRNAQITITYPQGTNFVTVRSVFDGSEIGKQFGANNSVTFAPINSVRAGEEVKYVFELNFDVPGQKIIGASVVSDGQPNPRQTQTDSTVLPRS